VETLTVEQGNGHAVVVEDPTTPVLPDKEPFPKRAYQLQWEIDVPLFAIGAALAMGREIRSTNSSAPAYCTTIPEGCDENDLNFVDKPFAGNYDESWSNATDWIIRGLFVAPLPLLWIDNTFLNMLNDVTIIYQSGLTALALSGLATMSAQRARPFVYGAKAPEEVRTSPNGALSFVSGHTTMAFALSTSTFWTIYRRHGPGVYAWTTLAVGTAAASMVAVGRVIAGKHFPTDVLTGAAVGASVGTLMPALHDAPVVVVPTVDKAGAGILVSTSL
jgi:membrane-associated phospholipid phosphatase